MNHILRRIDTEFQRIVKHTRNDHEACDALFRVYYELVITLSDASALQFNTLFARVSFIATRYPVAGAWRYILQIPRREMQHREITDADLVPILKASIQLLLNLYREEFLGEAPAKPPPLPAYAATPRAGTFIKKFARVNAIEWESSKRQLTVLDEDEPERSRILKYHVAGVNDIFTDTLELALKEIGLPMTLGLTHVECSDKEEYIPAYIVILPDLLIDVTAVAQFESNGPDPLAVNMMDVFLPKAQSDAILLGNIANFVLDEMIRDTDRSFKEIFTDAFKIFPIEFLHMTDDRLRHLYLRMSDHFVHIRKVLTDHFNKLGIDKQDCVIEPSYYSPQYGIKGRLDLYYENDADRTASIIELKSSKPFKPNSYGLSSAHYHQTLLYDLLVQTEHGKGFKRSNYILYSGESRDTMRFAASVEAIQKETILHRNQMVVLVFRMMQLDQKGSRDIFKEINTGDLIFLKGYLKRNVEAWEKFYTALSPGEQNYFKAFSAFITREHTLARIGSDRGDGSGGLAGLWLDTIERKEARYQILQHLELLSVDQEGHQTRITFLRTAGTNPLANFRAGDIVVMYPFSEEEQIDPTRYQLYRASLVSVDPENVVIRLRNMQVHTSRIERFQFWNLERDMLDSSFRSLYQSLWSLMNADPVKRHQLLGLLPFDTQNELSPIRCPVGLTETQQQVFEAGIQASGMYFLWGPPGTGKTSVMLKSWVNYYAVETNQRIVLVAYTNRAVDEICEAIESLGSELSQNYIRIGSSTATHEKFRHRLFDQVIEPLSSRSEIIGLLQQTKVYVATVSSLYGKSGLLDLVSFDLAIIDEASQLPEPSIVGLLTRFKKAILIGDHMQLPAVSIQSEELSRVDPTQEWSERIGITDMRMSYFERMFRLYQQKGWTRSIGMLNEQGRMHAEIMNVVNALVYDGFLKTIDPARQHPSFYDVLAEENDALFMHRLIFMPSEIAQDEFYLKTNQDEAAKVVAVIARWKHKMKHLGLEWSIGVITPFRAQIAAIAHLAHQENLDMDRVTIDTVERYQGGACDIIVMSCAVNTESALDKISSLNQEGVDRKLNVSISRARQQFILVGNEEILGNAGGYRDLMDMCFKWVAEDLSVSLASP